MRGPYSEYAAPPVYLYPERPKPGIRFSRIELFQLGVAIFALSAALTLLYVTSTLRAQRVPASELPLIVTIFFATSLVAVATGVGLHEIAHKAVAQRYGLWAEFRYNPMGLVLAFVFAMFGFIYGAPGATWISGYVTPERNGRISAAGPGTNVALGSMFLVASAVLTPLVRGPTLDVGSIALFVVQNAALMNLVLAGFNMIPVMPLDGAKVWTWNKIAYFGIIALVVVIFVGALYARWFSAVLG